MSMFDPDYNPFDQLQDLTNFCIAADKHIKALSEQHTILVEQFQKLNSRLVDLEIDKMEKQLDEIATSYRERDE